MNKLRQLTAVLGTLLVSLVMLVPAHAQDEADIVAALERWSEIYETATDAAEMQALYDPAAVFFGTGGQQPMVGADAFGPYFQNQFDNFTDRDHGFVDPVIRFYGDGNVATATGLYRFIVTPVAGGAPIEVLYRYTFAYVLTDDGWKIIQHHSSQLPPQ